MTSIEVYKGLFQPCKITRYYFANLSVSLKTDRAKNTPALQLVVQSHSRNITHVPALPAQHLKMQITLMLKGCWDLSVVVPGLPQGYFSFEDKNSFRQKEANKMYL